MSENIDPKDSSVVSAPLPAGLAQKTNNVAPPASPPSTSPSQSLPLTPAPAPATVVAAAPYPVKESAVAPVPTPVVVPAQAPVVAAAPSTFPVVAPVQAPSLDSAPAKRTRRGGAKHHVQLKACRSELVETFSEINTVQTSICSSVLANEQPSNELITKLQTLELRKAAMLSKSETVKNEYADASKKAAERRLCEATHGAAKSAARNATDPVAIPAAEIPGEVPPMPLSGLAPASVPPRSWASLSPESTSTVQIFTSPRLTAAVSGFPPSEVPAPAKRHIRSPDWANVPLPQSSAVQIKPPGSGPPRYRASSYAPRPGPSTYQSPSYAPHAGSLPHAGPAPYLAPPYAYQPVPSPYQVVAYGYQAHGGAYHPSGYLAQQVYGVTPPVVNAPAIAPHPVWPTDVIPRPPSQSSSTTKAVTKSNHKPHAASQPGWSTGNFPTSKSSNKTNSKSKGVASKSSTKASSAKTSAKATKAKSPVTAVVHPQSAKNTTEKQPPKTKASPKAASANAEKKQDDPEENTARKADTIKTEAPSKATSGTKKAKKTKKEKEKEQKKAAKTKALKDFKPRYFNSAVQGLYLPVNDGSADFDFAPTGNDIDLLFKKESPSTEIRVIMPDAPAAPGADFEFAPTGVDMDSLFDKKPPSSAIRINIPATPAAPTAPVTPSASDAPDASTVLAAPGSPSAAPESTDLPAEEEDFEEDYYVASAMRSGDFVMDCDPPAMGYEEDEEDYYIGSNTRDIVLDYDSPVVDSESESANSEDESETVVADVATTVPAAPEAPTPPVISSTVDVVAPTAPAAPNTAVPDAFVLAAEDFPPLESPALKVAKSAPAAPAEPAATIASASPASSTVPTTSKKPSPAKLLAAAHRRADKKSAAAATSSTFALSTEEFPDLASPTPKTVESTASTAATLVALNVSGGPTSYKKKSPCKLSRAARRRENRKAALATATIPDTSAQATKDLSLLASPTSISMVVGPIPIKALVTSLPDSVVSSPVIVPSKIPESVPDIALAMCLTKLPAPSPVMVGSTPAESATDIAPTTSLLESHVSSPVLVSSLVPGPVEVNALTVPLPESPTPVPVLDETNFAIELQISPSNSPEASPVTSKPSPAKTTKSVGARTKSKTSEPAPNLSRTFRIPTASSRVSSATQGTQSSLARRGSSISRPSSAASTRAPITRPSSAASVRTPMTRSSSATSIRATARKASDTPSSASMSRESSASSVRRSSVSNDTSASTRSSRSSLASVVLSGARSTSCTGSTTSTRERSQSSAPTGDRATTSKPSLAKLEPAKPITGPKSPSPAQRTPLTSLLPISRLKPTTPVTVPKSPAATPSTSTIEPPPLARLAPEKAVADFKSALVAPSAFAATRSSSSTASKDGGPRPGMRATAEAKGILYPKSKSSMSVTKAASMAGPMPSAIAHFRDQMSPIPGSPALPNATRLPTPTRSDNPYALYGQRGYDEDYSYGGK